MNQKSAPIDRASHGPFDLDELSEVRPYIDFGAIRIPARDDVSIRLEIEESTQRVIAITLEVADSSLQLQAFAAPKSEGIWLDIRDSMAQSITSQGGQIEIGIGALGAELNARLPLVDENGNTAGFRLAKFVGVDGPRWMLRGSIGGAALTDPKAAGEVVDLYRSIVIHRDDAPIPPRDLLNLSVPGGSVLPPGMN